MFKLELQTIHQFSQSQRRSLPIKAAAIIIRTCDFQNLWGILCDCENWWIVCSSTFNSSYQGKLTVRKPSVLSISSAASSQGQPPSSWYSDGDCACSASNIINITNMRTCYLSSYPLILLCLQVYIYDPSAIIWSPVWYQVMRRIWRDQGRGRGRYYL